MLIHEEPSVWFQPLRDKLSQMEVSQHLSNMQYRVSNQIRTKPMVSLAR